MAVLTQIKNPFDPLNSRDVLLVDGGKPLYEYFGKIDEAYEIVASVNGDITEDYKYVVSQNDSISFVAIPQGGGDGKNILATVAMIALIAASGGLAAGAMGATAGMVGAGAYGGLQGAIIYGAIQAGIVIGGGMLINGMLPPSTPSFDSPTSNMSGFDSSPTYGWNQQSNPTQEGGAIPVVYGTIRTYPSVISQFVRSTDEKQHLYILFAVAEGQVTSINDIIIDDQPLSSYTDIEFDWRDGSNTQTIINGFDNLRTDQSVNLLIDADEGGGLGWILKTTIGDRVDELVVTLTAPQGLSYANDTGGLDGRTIEIQIQYREVGDPTWTDFLVGGNTPSLSGRTRDLIRKTFTISGLTPAQYEVRTFRDTAKPTSPRYADDIYYEALTEVVYEDYLYPNTALLSIKALATNQLSGGLPRVSCQVTANSNNPALIIQDILTNSRYGADISSAKIDTATFATWETFCTDNDFAANIIFDSTQNIKDALNSISTLGRASIIQSGSTFLPIIDKVENLAVQRFLFTMGNIVRKSFKEDFLPLVDRSNVIEVTYYDETLDYERQSIELYQNGFDGTNDDVRKSSITLYACTNRDMAIKHGRYMLNKNRYLTNVVSFDADVDSIACQVGDVIDIAHDVPEWGYSGRIVEAIAGNDPATWVYEDDVYVDGVYIDDVPEWVYEDDVYVNGVYVDETTLNLIRIDREVTLEAGVDYLFAVKFNSDDSREFLTVSTSATITTDLIPMGEGFAKPVEEYMLYSIGEVNLETKLFRVQAITRSADQKRKITAFEYLPEIYEDDVDTLPAIGESTLPNVSVLFANFEWQYNVSGLGEGVVKLSWSGSATIYGIWYRNVLDTEYTYLEHTTKQTYEIKNLAAATYEFKVIDTLVQVTVSGSPEAPIPPTDVTATLQNKQIIVDWTFAPYENITAYNIKLNGTLVQENFKGNEYTYPKQLSDGAYIFSVASVNIYNKISTYEDANTITVTAVPSITSVTAYSKATAVQFHVTYTPFTDFSHIQVYESLTNNVANKYELFKQELSNFSRGGLDIIDTRYYWFELVDVYGNTGALYGVVIGSTETDPDVLMAILKAQQNTEQYLPVLSDVLLVGIVNGENVVGVDGSLVVDGSIIAGKIAAESITADDIAAGTITADEIAASTITSTEMATNVLLIGGEVESSNYSWNSGTPIGFGMWSTGDGDSGEAYNIIGGSIYGSELTGSTLNISDINIKDINGNTVASGFGGTVLINWDGGLDTFSLTTNIINGGTDPYRLLSGGGYLSMSHTVDYSSFAPLTAGYMFLFSCDDVSIPVTIKDNTTSRATGTINSNGATIIGGMEFFRVYDTGYTNDYHIFIKEQNIPSVTLNTGLVIELVQTDGAFTFLSTNVTYTVANM